MIWDKSIFHIVVSGLEDYEFQLKPGFNPKFPCIKNSLIDMLVCVCVRADSEVKNTNASKLDLNLSKFYKKLKYTINYNF